MVGWGGKEKKTEFKTTFILFVSLDQWDFSIVCNGMGEQNVTDVIRERTPLLWRTVREKSVGLRFLC